MMTKETLDYFLKKIADAQNTFGANPETDIRKKFESYRNQIRTTREQLLKCFWNNTKQTKNDTSFSTKNTKFALQPMLKEVADVIDKKATVIGWTEEIGKHAGKARQRELDKLNCCEYRKYCYIVIAMVCLIIIAGCGRNSKREIATIPPCLEALPSDSYAYGDNGMMLYRIISLEKEFYKFRKPDYKGGFYLWLQLAWTTNKEVQNNVSFDSLKYIPKNYIVHYEPLNGGMSTNDWTIPDFYVYYKELTPPFDVINFNYSDTAGWKSYIEAYAEGKMPDYMLLFTSLNRYTAKKREEKPDHDSRNISLHIYEHEEPFTSKEIFQTINKLKREGCYDTILTRDNGHAIYINIDRQCIEQPAQPDAFYFTSLKFYPNGFLSEKYHFLPGRYSSQALVFGYTEHFDENGEMVYCHFPDIEYFPSPFSGASLPYLFDLLKYEGWIDPEDGKRKPVMTINKNVFPYSETERLSIHCTWNIQVDHNVTGSAGLLVQCDDTTQIVYLIDKLSGNILDRFKRR